MTFTPQEIQRLTDTSFFLNKATITTKIRQQLEQLHEVYQQELCQHSLLVPDQFSSEAFQFVKGEQLEHFPYQYLDYPRFYTRETKFAFRTLFWWGHHLIFSLILEGVHIRRYKENLFNRFSEIADRHVCLCLDNSLWEWKQGPGYTFEITRERKPEVAAVLANRPFFKLAMFIPFDDSVITSGNVDTKGLEALRSMLPVITQ
ncbi:MAG: hypothetical protein O2999_14005 [Nitrospirae bacterium]|nr:hypothetical protein [Nitrospirota bacterium]MDA1305382.1 hypothetical protein [Nitrospirota bacterium]